MEAASARTLHLPLGMLTLTATGRGLRHVDFDAGGAQRAREAAGRYQRDGGAGREALDAAEKWLCAYFTRVEAPLPALDARLTPFLRRVLSVVEAIPRGTTLTLEELCRTLGGPRAYRRVALAVMANPLPIALPCHRVIASESGLPYPGGAQIKRALLLHEGVRWVRTAEDDE